MEFIEVDQTTAITFQYTYECRKALRIKQDDHTYALLFDGRVSFPTAKSVRECNTRIANYVMYGNR